jgi:phenylacetate-CoA ligase
MLAGATVRLLRKFILARGRRMNPDRMLERSRRGAARAAVRAARNSKAYRSLLREHQVQPTSIGVHTDLKTLPVLSKGNTFERFSLDELSRPIRATELADVLTSSGRGGPHFGFRLTGRKQYEASWFDIDLGLQDVFSVDDYPTLLVNCLPMGVVFQSRAVTVANVSVREDMACSILRDVGPRFAQTLLCTDPLFIRRVLNEAHRAGVDWKAINASVILGEEVLVEAQRDYIAARMGIDVDRDRHRFIGSSFGVGELGLNLLFETRETIRIRRAVRAQPDVAPSFSGFAGGGSMPSIFCFNPLRCHIEVLNPGSDGFGELCFTMLDPNAVIVLPRYATGDLGKLISRDEVARAAALAQTPEPWLPVLALRGRIRDRRAGMPSVESIKELIYSNHAFADQLSGAFRIAQNDHGQVTLILQVSDEPSAIDATLSESFKMMVDSTLKMPVAVELAARDSFPWRPALDYERKFAYLAPEAL